MILFESFSGIEKILERYGIENYTIDKDGLVNVDGSVNLWNKVLNRIPIKFGYVTGDFNCSHNQLTSLEGSPKRVGGEFSCSHNQLRSLLGGPEEVGGDFYCNGNNLKSLEGAPQRVDGNFCCSDNNQMTHEPLSLVGAPKKVGAGFYCEKSNIISLEGAPIIVDGGFNCRYNKIISFEGAPKQVGGFYCNGNPISKIWYLFNDYSKIELLNDYDAIQDGVIILDRLNAFLTHLGKNPIEYVSDYISI